VQRGEVVDHPHRHRFASDVEAQGLGTCHQLAALGISDAALTEASTTMPPAPGALNGGPH
jgi:hypothetical protein